MSIKLFIHLSDIFRVYVQPFILRLFVSMGGIFPEKIGAYFILRAFLWRCETTHRTILDAISRDLMSIWRFRRDFSRSFIRTRNQELNDFGWDISRINFRLFHSVDVISRESISSISYFGRNISRFFIRTRDQELNDFGRDISSLNFRLFHFLDVISRESISSIWHFEEDISRSFFQTRDEEPNDFGRDISSPNFRLFHSNIPQPIFAS